MESSEAAEMSHRPPLGIVIDGEHWAPIFTAENIRSAKSMMPRPEDIFICTSPKCGTTWTQHIVHLLMGRADYDMKAADGNSETSMTRISPMIEFMGADYCETLKSPRILKSHLSYSNIPKDGGAKYIFVVRNPKDALVSYYYHHRNFTCFDFENGDFDVFYEMFMDGQVGCGEYFDHFTSWLDALEKKEENILFLKYEDMVGDLRSAVVAIADFLGGEAANLVKDEQHLNKIVEASTLASMKKDQQRWFPYEYQRGNFVRKGGSRDWKNHFTKEQSDRMDERFRERCTGSAAAAWWRAEMAWNDEE